MLIVDCEQSPFFFRFNEGGACARASSGEAARETRETSAAVKILPLERLFECSSLTKLLTLGTAIYLNLKCGS